MGHAMEMISRVARLPHETGLYYEEKYHHKNSCRHYRQLFQCPLQTEPTDEQCCL